MYDVDVFDLCRVLLQNADLLVSSGRRYGLVGRNGLGKSTLLCALSRYVHTYVRTYVCVVVDLYDLYTFHR